MSGRELERFSPAERLFHWSNAAAVMFLLATGGLIWQDLDKWRPNGINVVADGHVWLGGGLLVLGAVAFLLSRRQRIAQAAKRFNAGQKLNLRLFQLLLPLMVGSGVVVKFGKAWGMSKPARHLVKEGHLVLAFTVLALVAGHLAMVLVVRKNRGVLGAMLTGRIDRQVAERVAPEWLAAVQQEPPAAHGYAGTATR